MKKNKRKSKLFKTKVAKKQALVVLGVVILLAFVGSGAVALQRQQQKIESLEKIMMNLEQPAVTQASDPSPIPESTTEIKYLEKESNNTSELVVKCAEKVENFKKVAKEEGFSDFAVSVWLKRSNAYSNCLDGKQPNSVSRTPSYFGDTFDIPGSSMDTFDNYDNDRRLRELERRQEEAQQRLERQERAKSYDCIEAGGVWSRFNGICSFY